MSIRYAHVNIVARDWKRLARFYKEVFQCREVPPERDHHGPWVERLTGVPGVRVRGIHLRVPGWGDQGPTIEIFQFDPPGPADEKAIYRQGLAHLAFVVPDLEESRRQILSRGGGQLGTVETIQIRDWGTLTLVYMTDPEGNIVELQQWS